MRVPGAVCFLLANILHLHAHSELPVFLRGRPIDGLMGYLEDDFDSQYTFTEDDFLEYSNITQPLDHFNASNSATWTQQYQYNSKFYNKDRPLAFLMIGGEGPIGGGGDKWVRNENVSMMVWAKEFGAAAFQVEHRFYGDSRPFPEQTTEALRSLTVEQVLADLKSFIQQMNQMYFADVQPRWITFGGSYPGSLSAWFRATYPDMTIAAVSSSSAVNVRVDYYGYAVNTEANYRAVNDDCAHNIGVGFRMLINDAYRSNELREALTSGYKLCTNFTGELLSKEVQFFFSNLYAIYQDINQYSGDNRNSITNAGLNLENACERMTGGTGYGSVHVKKLVEWYNKINNISCIPNNYTDFIAGLQKTDYSDMDLASYRTWIWQTCTFLGYFQTTDGGNKGVFGSIIPLDFYVDQCVEIFGPEFTADYTFDAVQRTLDQYGGDKGYKGTKVVFPNGSIDPWKSLGKLTPNQENDVDAFIIDGTAHCADMYPARDSDLASLVAGRQRIHDHLARWIKEAFDTSSNSTTTTTATHTTTSTQGSASGIASLLSFAALRLLW